jgi:hypothetical protein
MQSSFAHGCPNLAPPESIVIKFSLHKLSPVVSHGQSCDENNAIVFYTTKQILSGCNDKNKVQKDFPMSVATEKYECFKEIVPSYHVRQQEQNDFNCK